MPANIPTSSHLTDIQKRVLVFSSDILPYPGLPTVGSGLRAWGLGQGLMSCGHEVTFSIPQAALEGRRHLVPPEVADLAWEHHTFTNVVRKAAPDVVVVCGWPLMTSFPADRLDIPVVLDQHGPHMLERQFQQFGDPDENAQRKINALSKADYFLCAGQKQWHYFQNWLEKAGWSEEERQRCSGFIPVSLSPDLPDRNPGSELAFVYGGVFLPWQDPTNGLFGLIHAMEKYQRGRLYLFGGKHPVYPVSSGIFEELLQQLTQSEYVVAPGMVSHDDLIRQYSQSHVAIDVMKRNPERELAFTTRTVEYLWCGLPVLYQNYAELSDYIQSYDAGWLVNPDSIDEIEVALTEIFENPDLVAQRSKNARRLVRQELTWDKTIDPLNHFVRHPTRRHHDAPGEPLIVQNAKYLLEEAWFHYRRNGIAGLWKEGWSFLRRQF
jgi:glycosyltransferase involved in cell wall biosynthesis